MAKRIINKAEEGYSSRAKINDNFTDLYNADAMLENNLFEHLEDFNNPHKTTASSIGLENVDNIKQAPFTHIGSNGVSQHALATGSIAGFSSNNYTTYDRNKVVNLPSDTNFELSQKLEVANIRQGDNIILTTEGNNVTISATNVGGEPNPGGGVTDHAKLSNLDYDNSGHTGFAKEEHNHDLSTLDGTLIGEQVLVDIPNEGEISVQDTLSELWNFMTTMPEIPDITVTNEKRFFFHPDGSIRRYKPNTNVGIQVTVPANGVWTTKEFTYTVATYEDEPIFPLSTYLVDLFFDGMNPGETYNFKVKLFGAGRTLISETTAQHTADSVGHDRVSILSTDNKLVVPMQTVVGGKLILSLEIMTNATTNKTLYIKSDVVKNYFSSMRQNPADTSSELQGHFTDDDKMTTTAKELRKHEVELDALNRELIQKSIIIRQNTDNISTNGRIMTDHIDSQDIHLTPEQVQKLNLLDGLKQPVVDTFRFIEATDSTDAKAKSLANPTAIVFVKKV